MPFDLATVLVLLTVGLVTPGPDMMIVLKNSLGGRARGMATVAGIALGFGLQTTALSAGFTLLAGHTATIFEVLRWGGTCVLLFIGARALFSRTPTTGEFTPAVTPAGTRSAFLEGLLCNLTNPKHRQWGQALRACCPNRLGD